MTITKLRVHIAPVGFEVDRIVLPAVEMRADKVWLLMHDNPKSPHAKSYDDKIVSVFKERGIGIGVAKADRKSTFKILQAVKSIIKNEAGNDIYVNVSSGSKIQAIACMMACMMFNKDDNLTPYYAEPRKYPAHKEQLSAGLKDIIEMPKYHIQIPSDKLIRAMNIISNNGNSITKKKMSMLAESEGLIVVNSKKENFEQARYASLDKNIIQPLVDQWKYVEVEKIGRTRWIKLTQNGISAMEILT